MWSADLAAGYYEDSEAGARATLRPWRRLGQQLCSGGFRVFGVAYGRRVIDITALSALGLSLKGFSDLDRLDPDTQVPALADNRRRRRIRSDCLCFRRIKT